ncbi:hypothetical protein [Actinophytocola sp.]|uniref:hypothetical protein n=1 Tax=Actinophytocola sp. TaxID=1872138 RepID=UPI002ED617DB
MTSFVVDFGAGGSSDPGGGEVSDDGGVDGSDGSDGSDGWVGAEDSVDGGVDGVSVGSALASAVVVTRPSIAATIANPSLDTRLFEERTAITSVA